MELGESSPRAQRRDFVAPRTPAEEVVAAVWCTTLSLDEVGLYDDLTSLGAGDLAATQVSFYLSSIFQADLSPERLLQTSTLDGQVALLSQTWEGRDVVEEIAWTFLQIQELSDEQVREKLIIETDASRKEIIAGKTPDIGE